MLADMTESGEGVKIYLEFSSSSPFSPLTSQELPDGGCKRKLLFSQRKYVLSQNGQQQLHLPTPAMNREESEVLVGKWKRIREISSRFKFTSTFLPVHI